MGDSEDNNPDPFRNSDGSSSPSGQRRDGFWESWDHQPPSQQSWLSLTDCHRFSASNAAPAEGTKAYDLGLSFDTLAQRDEALAVLQHLPELQDALRQRSVASAIDFLMDKPEIYHHDSLAWHLLQNARLCNQFMSEVGALTSQEVAELGQSQAKNRAAHAHRVKTENKIFAVEFQGDDRYPAFQFDLNTGKPKPVIKQMLEILKGEWSGWQLAFR